MFRALIALALALSLVLMGSCGASPSNPGNDNPPGDTSGGDAALDAEPLPDGYIPDTVDQDQDDAKPPADGEGTGDTKDETVAPPAATTFTGEFVSVGGLLSSVAYRLRVLLGPPNSLAPAKSESFRLRAF